MLSGILVVAAFLFATSDAHAERQNCGSALIPRDTTSLGLDTGNVAKDDFSVEEVADDCNQIILRQRYFLALCVGGAVLCSVVAGRLRTREEPQFPGDPIV